MQFVKAPDFPTGGIICGTGGARQAYETGRGRVVQRARCMLRKSVRIARPGGHRDSLRHQALNHHRIDQKSGERRARTGYSRDLRGTVKEGVRLVLDLKQGEDADVVLNQLWKHTGLQTSTAST